MITLSSLLYQEYLMQMRSRLPARMDTLLVSMTESLKNLKFQIIYSTLIKMTMTVSFLSFLEIIQRGNVGSRLTELDRLSYLVNQIDYDCAVVPDPAMKSSQTGELMINLGYTGQTPEEIAMLQSYKHFRSTDEEKRLRIHGKLFVTSVESNRKSINTLEPITDDLPKSTWSLVLDSSKLVAYLRSFKWPGFLAYNRANSSIHGYCYFGDGRKNIDLSFTS